MGETAALSRVADPRELRAIRLGGPAADGSAGSRIQLRWRWPPEAGSTRLAARQGSPPSGPDDPEAIIATVAQDAYDRLGSWTLNLPRAGLDESSDLEIHAEPGTSNGPLPLRSDRWYITAYSVAEKDGQTLLSPGLEPTATTIVPGPHPEITVSYTLRRSWFPGRGWSVTMHTEPSAAAVPPMVLVANDRAIPLSADDGQVVARFPASHDGSTHPFRAPMNLARCGVRAFLDPTVEPSSLAPIRLRHPEAGPTRA